MNDNKHCHDHHEDGCCCHHHHHHEGECCHHHHDEECGCCHEHKENHFVILIIRAVVTIILLVISRFLQGIFKDGILIIAYLIISYDIISNAFKNIIKGRALDENLLMSLASMTALIVPIFTDEAHIDQYDGILVMILYQIGEFIQHKAVDKSKKSIIDMLDLDVEEVTIVDSCGTKKKNVIDIAIDDVIIVMPGDMIVVDGEVVYGSSSLDTSSLTGESMPVSIGVSDKVLSGSINIEGVIHMKATSTIRNSTTAKVKEIVEKANKNKANIDRFFTRFARIYTPIVILISLFVMFILPLIVGFEKHFLSYLYKGLAIMVISCPCALVISIPLAYFMGIGKAAKNQILIKGASYLEILGDIDTICFDKTGTLTKGNFKIREIKSHDMELMKNMLYSVERNFTHSIATSITCELKDEAEELEITDLVNIPGYGVKAIFDDKEILVGNYKLLKENGVSFDEITTESTIIYVSFDKEFLGYVIIEDELKNDAIKTINELLNNHKIYIISGDKKSSVSRVAEKLNIKEYHSELLPNDKIKVLEEIKENGKVIYVGDGINDAACLVSATVGIAMKSIGSDIAIEASDIVLMNDELGNVSKAIKISKKTKGIVIQNIIFSLLIKVIVMLAAIFIGVPMYLAIIADVGVAMLAVLNSLRIMYTKI